MNCPSPEDLVAYVDGEADEPSHAEIARHVSACAICAAEVDDLRRLTAWGRSAVSQLPVGMQPELRLVNGRARRRRVLVWTAATTAAAALVIVSAMIAARFLPMDAKVEVEVVHAKPETSPATTPVSDTDSRDEMFAKWAETLRRRAPVALVSMEEVANFRPPIERPVTSLDLDPA